VFGDGNEEIISGLVKVNCVVTPLKPDTLGSEDSETTTGIENLKFVVAFWTGGIRVVSEVEDKSFGREVGPSLKGLVSRLEVLELGMFSVVVFSGDDDLAEMVLN
jgi:hypothetical protein